MNREVHVRFCESGRGKLPPATQPSGDTTVGGMVKKKNQPRNNTKVTKDVTCFFVSSDVGQTKRSFVCRSFNHVAARFSTPQGQDSGTS